MTGNEWRLCQATVSTQLQRAELGMDTGSPMLWLLHSQERSKKKKIRVDFGAWEPSTKMVGENGGGRNVQNESCQDGDTAVPEASGLCVVSGFWATFVL